MTKKEQVKNKIIEAVPEIKKQGCYAWGDEPSNHYCSNCDTTIKQPIQLADVLIAISKIKGEDAWKFAIDSLGRFMRDWGEDRYETDSAEWNLNETYDNQSDEVINFLHEILV